MAPDTFQRLKTILEKLEALLRPHEMLRVRVQFLFLLENINFQTTEDCYGTTSNQELALLYDDLLSTIRYIHGISNDKLRAFNLNYAIALLTESAPPSNPPTLTELQIPRLRFFRNHSALPPRLCRQLSLQRHASNPKFYCEPRLFHFLKNSNSSDVSFWELYLPICSSNAQIFRYLLNHQEMLNIPPIDNDQLLDLLIKNERLQHADGKTKISIEFLRELALQLFNQDQSSLTWRNLNGGNIWCMLVEAINHADGVPHRDGRYQASMEISQNDYVEEPNNDTMQSWQENWKTLIRKFIYDPISADSTILTLLFRKLENPENTPWRLFAETDLGLKLLGNILKHFPDLVIPEQVWYEQLNGVTTLQRLSLDGPLLIKCLEHSPGLKISAHELFRETETDQSPMQNLLEMPNYEHHPMLTIFANNPELTIPVAELPNYYNLLATTPVGLELLELLTERDPQFTLDNQLLNAEIPITQQDRHFGGLPPICFYTHPLRQQLLLTLLQRRDNLHLTPTTLVKPLYEGTSKTPFSYLATTETGLAILNLCRNRYRQMLQEPFLLQFSSTYEFQNVVDALKKSAAGKEFLHLLKNADGLKADFNDDGAASAVGTFGKSGKRRKAAIASAATQETPPEAATQSYQNS
jgi:hypothetical protein